MVRTIIILFCICLCGCAKTKTVTETVYITEYRDVLVPVKCDVEIPSKPSLNKDENFPSLINRILKSYDDLENLLIYCKGENE